MSTSSLTLSSGGPLSLSASLLSDSRPAALTRIVRVSVSGLYWKMTMLESGSITLTPTTAPLSSFGEPGKLDTARSLSQSRHGRVTRPSRRGARSGRGDELVDVRPGAGRDHPAASLDLAPELDQEVGHVARVEPPDGQLWEILAAIDAAIGLVRSAAGVPVLILAARRRRRRLAGLLSVAVVRARAVRHAVLAHHGRQPSTRDVSEGAGHVDADAAGGPRDARDSGDELAVLELGAVAPAREARLDHVVPPDLRGAAGAGRRRPFVRMPDHAEHREAVLRLRARPLARLLLDDEVERVRPDLAVLLQAVLLLRRGDRDDVLARPAPRDRAA